MKLIRPTAVTDAVLTASSAIETSTNDLWDSTVSYAISAEVATVAGTQVFIWRPLAAPNLNHPPASSPTWWRLISTTWLPYNSGTTYALEATVLSAGTHRVYESLQAGNIGHPLTDGAWWLDVGPTNRWAMFDDKVGSLTRRTGTLSVTLTPGAIDALAVVDVDAELVQVTMTDGGTTVYDSTQSTNVGGVAITDWFLYFFEPIGARSALTFLDLPIFPAATVAVSFTGRDPGGPVTCGTLIVGRQMDLGSAEAGAEVGIIDFSRKVTDDFGVTGVVERAWAKRLRVRVLTQTAAIDAIQATLAAIRARPVLWIAAEGFDSLTVYGFYKEFSIDVAYGNISYCSLSIEGLI